MPVLTLSETCSSVAAPGSAAAGGLPGPGGVGGRKDAM